MAEKSFKISSLNIFEVNLHMLALLPASSWTLNGSFSSQPLCHWISEPSSSKVCMFTKPFTGKYARFLPVQLAGWVRASCRIDARQTCVGHFWAWSDGLGWGQHFGVKPFDLHWALLYLAHYVGGISLWVPPKHPPNVSARNKKPPILCRK